MARVYNSAHQELIVKDLGRMIEKHKVKLVSWIARWRTTGRSFWAGKSRREAAKAQSLHARSPEGRRGVQYCDRAYEPSSGRPDSFFGDPTRATGGHVCSHEHIPDLPEEGGQEPYRKDESQPYHAERDIVFMLDERGIDDPPEESSKRKVEQVTV